MSIFNQNKKMSKSSKLLETEELTVGLDRGHHLFIKHLINSCISNEPEMDVNLVINDRSYKLLAKIDIVEEPKEPIFYLKARKSVTDKKKKERGKLVGRERKVKRYSSDSVKSKRTVFNELNEMNKDHVVKVIFSQYGPKVVDYFREKNMMDYWLVLKILLNIRIIL